MHKEDYTIETNNKSIAIGIVIGITLTAVVVSIQAFFGVGDFNRSFRQVVDQIKSNFIIAGNGSDSDFTYPAYDEIVNYDTSNWQAYLNEELSFSFKYPSTWTIETMGKADCTKPENKTDCFTVIVTETEKTDDTAKSIIVSTSSDLKQIEGVSKFPVVLYVEDTEKIFYQFRKSDCTITNQVTVSQTCAPDPEGHLQFTNSSFKAGDSKLEVFLYGDPNIEEAVILNSLRF